MRFLYPPDGEEEEGKEDADEGADGDFFWFMTDAFFEAGEARFVELEFFGERVEVLRMLAHIDAEPKRVKDDDDGEGERNRETRRCESIDKCDRGDK